MPPNVVLLGNRYEAYVTVLAGQAGGPLIYIDHQGHIHVVPTTPDSRRIIEELTPEVRQVQVQLAALAEKVHELTGQAVAAGD